MEITGVVKLNFYFQFKQKIKTMLSINLYPTSEYTLSMLAVILKIIHLVQPSGKCITLPIEPRFRARDINLNHISITIQS